MPIHLNGGLRSTASIPGATDDKGYISRLAILSGLNTSTNQPDNLGEVSSIASSLMSFDRIVRT